MLIKPITVVTGLHAPRERLCRSKHTTCQAYSPRYIMLTLNIHMQKHGVLRSSNIDPCDDLLGLVIVRNLINQDNEEVYIATLDVS